MRLAAIFLALLTLAVPPAGCRQAPVFPKAVAPPMTDADLMAFYKMVNENYFMGQLPKNTLVKWADLAQYDDMGRTTNPSKGVYIITIDYRTNPVERQAKLTELHEICHIPNFAEKEEQGPKWTACMVRLAEMGALKDLW